MNLIREGIITENIIKQTGRSLIVSLVFQEIEKVPTELIEPYEINLIPGAPVVKVKERTD